MQQHAGTKGVSETSYEIARGKSGCCGLQFVERISEAQGFSLLVLRVSQSLDH